MTKTNGQPSPTLEQRLRAAAGDVEVELKRLITYVNDEVVPDVRRNGSHALRVASVELEKLAHRMDEANRKS
ncbi:hypothetical protein [Granulicella tundricola]|uniref:Uncharacterized protein n=1 Tax=Granulicella tundricola (strain ATCC BAA-1859 / DSM 23138 / MP5ACTX9) TaxID=1198114 RepID=E8X3W4_GRATM|nr:hypothetical protein [Granulicella tundricola]ADW70472.1 hypothetical protein AciX9_3467 [Granulicella tundricola MP5ACTX9]